MGVLPAGNPKRTISPEEKQQARTIIKYLRDKGITHLELARKLGLNKSSVHTWFYGGAFPSKRSFSSLVQVYKEYTSLYQNINN